MGTTSTTLSFRGTSQEAIAAAYRSGFPKQPALIAPVRKGWVTVFDAACDYGQKIETTVPFLCRECDAPCFALVLVNSQYLFYWVYDRRGELVDRSFPLDPENPTREEAYGLAGSPEQIADVFGDGFTGAQVREILEETPLIGDAMWKLAQLLGIEYMGLTYHEIMHPFQRIGEGVYPEDWDQFILVGDHEGWEPPWSGVENLEFSPVEVFEDQTSVVSEEPGLSSGTLSFFGTSQERVANAYRTVLDYHRAVISPERNGWVTVIDEFCDLGGPVLDQIVPPLCQASDAPCLVLVLVNSSEFYYWLYDRQGQLVDKSSPRNYRVPRPEETTGLAGRPEAIAEVFGTGFDGAQIQAVLEKGQSDVTQILWNLAKLLGIVHVGLTYKEIFYNWRMLNNDRMPDWSEFVFIGRDDPRPR